MCSFNNLHKPRLARRRTARKCNVLSAVGVDSLQGVTNNSHQQEYYASHDVKLHDQAASYPMMTYMIFP